jgi:hypothetical protein
MIQYDYSESGFFLSWIQGVKKAPDPEMEFLSGIFSRGFWA